MWWKHVETSLYDFKLMLQCFSHFTVQQLNNSTLMIISNFIQFNFLPFLAGELFFANPKTAASISLGHQKVIIHAWISNQTKTFTCSVWNCGDTLMVFFHARMPYLWICFRSAKRLGQCLCQHLAYTQCEMVWLCIILNSTGVIKWTRLYSPLLFNLRCKMCVKSQNSPTLQDISNTYE